jgi:hypothetical protein
MAMSKEEPRFDIETWEYEQERHIFDLWRWINEKLSQMRAVDEFDVIYFERKDSNVKRLIEEAIPVACLGLHFVRPAEEVYIQFWDRNQPSHDKHRQFDATLKVGGFHNLSIEVEVTIAEMNDSHMRRQALSRNGFTYLTGPIRKDGRNIVSEPQIVDSDEEDARWVDCAFDRLQAKLKNPAYGSNTAILICLSTDRFLSLERRTELILKTEKHLLREKPNIFGVYYCQVGEFVDGIRCADLP